MQSSAAPTRDAPPPDRSLVPVTDRVDDHGVRSRCNGRARAHELDRRAAVLARSQHGIVSRAQVLALGAASHHVDHRLATRRWERVFEGVYRLAGAPSSWRQRLLAACWAGGERAVASHRSAAALWGLPGGEELLEITAPRWRRSRHEGILGHESRQLDERDITWVDGVPVTRPTRTLCDLAMVVDERTLELALEEAVRRGLTDVARLWERWERFGGRLRRGGTLLRAVLDRWVPGDRRPNVPEAMLRQLLREHGLPEPVPQYRVWTSAGRFRDLDWAYPDRRLAIEFDSYRYHGGALAHVADLRRHNELVALGWSCIRVSDDELARGAPAALDAIASFLGVRDTG